MARSTTDASADEVNREVELLMSFGRQHDLGSSDLVRLCTIHNPTDRPANTLFSAIYDRRKKHWLAWGSSRSSLRGSQPTLIPFSAEPRSVDELSAALVELY